MGEGDLAFVIAAGFLVVVAVLWAFTLCVSHSAQICSTLRRYVSTILRSSRVDSSGTAERRYIEEKILEEKTELGRKIVFVLLYFGVGNLTNILYNMFMGNALWMSTSGCWIVVIAVMLLLLAQVPSLLSARTVDVWSAVLQLIVLAFLSELATSAHETLMLGSGLFVTICVPAAAFANRISVLLLCQLSLILHSVVRAFRDYEEFQLATQCNALNGAQTFVFAHLVFLPLALSVSIWAHQLMEHRVESRFRESKSQTQLSAASALLDLTCDAVFQLDDDLRLLSHSGSLAALLMRNRAGATLKGLQFTDLVVPEDVQRVTATLDTKGPDGSVDAVAHVFRTYLMDSYDSRFGAEVFQVKFTMASGEKCHIVGLRDVTDVQPLADHSFHSLTQRLDTVKLEIKKHDGINELESLSSLWRHPLSRRSSECSTASAPVTPLAVGPGPTDSRTPSVSLTEEKAVSPSISSTKEVFLEVDVENELIKGATAPLVELVGRRLVEVTFSDFALQICKRLCEDAAAFHNSNQALPDQTANFNDMPLLVLAPHLIEASGFVKVFRTDAGTFHVLICVRKRKMKMCSEMNYLRSLWPPSPGG